MKVLGKFNEINSDDIGQGTVIANFTYIGKNVTIGKNCKIHNHCSINDGVVIGDNCLINDYCLFNSNTRIGNNVMFGAGVLTADEKIMSLDTKNITRIPCEIQDNVKVGQGARLISTIIGNGSVIGAGSVVLDNIPSYQVWAGVPAKYLRRITSYDVV